jgi:bifunctional non-homologous end joining protein LigD
MPLHFPVAPMKAVLGTLPPDDHNWAYEIKFDGYRALALVEEGQVRVQHGSGREVTDHYPELSSLHESVHADRAILDGELVVLDDEGVPRFELMQQHRREVVFQLFDVLHLGGHDTIELPYEDRRRLLEQAVEPGSNWLVPRFQIGDGQALLDATDAQGMEGVMAKRLGSTYMVGKRSPNWVKIKHRRQVEVVIGGFSEGSGNRERTFGSLLVGRWDGDHLAFAGGVGTGFGQSTLEALSAQLRWLEQRECPFDPLPPTSYRRGAHWVEPVLTAQIEITEFTNEGFVRHASFVGLADV